MRKIVVSFVLFCCLLPLSVTHASNSGIRLMPMGSPLNRDIVITSPYGPRKLNGHDFHHGFDCAADAGEPVYAVAAGYVDAVLSTNDGGIVILSHNDGAFYTAYIDLGYNLPYANRIGEKVERGTIIGYIGGDEVANSTGSHLHFEVRSPPGGAGTGLDPALYAPYAPWLPANASVNGVGGAAAHKDMVWDPSFAFLEPIQKAIDTIAQACTKGVDLLKGIIRYIITILMTIDLTMTYIMLAVDRDKGQEPGFSIFKLLALKMLLYLMLFFLITEWGGFIINSARDFFIGVGSAASGIDLAQGKQNLVDPTNLVTRGAKIIAPIFTVLNETDASFLDWFEKIVTSLVAGFFIIIIFGSFVLYAMEIALAYLEFYIVSLFSISTFFFAGVKWTRRFAENSMNGIFAASIKLFFLCFFASMLQAVTTDMVVGDVIHMKEVVVNEAVQKENGPFGGRDDVDSVLEAIRKVETGGQSDPFHTPSMDGYGYGAYQLSYEFWGGKNGWAADAGFPEWANIMPWEDGSSAWVSYAYESRNYSGAWEPVFADVPATNPWPPNVQTAVARHHLLGLYDTYKNWRMACIRWNGSGSAAEAYWGKVVNASASIQRTKHVLQIGLLVKISIVCILFVLMGDRLSKVIIKQFGTNNGFRFLPGT